MLAVTTGMRRGELLALRWSWVDMKNRSLYVRSTVDRIPGSGYVESEPKTSSSRRKILLPPLVVEALEQQQRQDAERAKAGKSWHKNDQVFCNTRGEYFHPAHLYTMFQQLLKKADLPSIRFHDLRHSAATILMAMGVHVKVIQELLGHSNIALTLNMYGHALPSKQAEASEKWDDLFGEQGERRGGDEAESERQE